jgi:neutral ceramidase
MIEAGAAVADITPGLGVPMGGYGARTGVAEDIHDPLMVRAMVLSDGTSKIAVAVCDLVGVTPDLVGQARDIIEAETGIPSTHVLISATHTHSGPGTIRIGVEGDGGAFLAETARKIAGAIRLANRRLTPVTLKVGTVEVTTISQNRRDPEGPIETVATVLLAAPPGNGPAVATLVNYACHSTVLEADNLEFSPDFPGAMARFLERTVGGTAVYLQGAAGDINPAWMSHDFAEVERVGGILGAAAVRTAHELRPLGEEQWVVNLNWSELTAKEAAPGTVLEDVSLGAWTTMLPVERRTLPDKETMGKEIAESEAALKGFSDEQIEQRHKETARLNALHMESLFARARSAGRMPDPVKEFELQVLRISPQCVIASLPGEFFVETGRAVASAIGLPHVLIAGYANGYVGYVPTAEQFSEGGYEVGCAQFEPDTAERVTRALADGAASLVI